MKTFLVCLFSFLLFLGSGQNPPEETILWGSKQLEWTDFRGTPDQNKAAAQSACLIHLQMPEWVGPEQKIILETLFRKNLSWVKSPNDRLLQHEQVHFDIAELFARKLRLKIISGNFSSHNYDSEIMKLFRETNQAMEKYQDLYDRETQFSLNDQQQQKWQKKTAVELKTLSSAADPVMMIRFR